MLLALAAFTATGSVHGCECQTATSVPQATCGEAVCASGLECRTVTCAELFELNQRYDVRASDFGVLACWAPGENCAGGGPAVAPAPAPSSLECPDTGGAGGDAPGGGAQGGGQVGGAAEEGSGGAERERDDGGGGGQGGSGSTEGGSGGAVALQEPTTEACLAPNPGDTGNTDLLLKGFGVQAFDMRVERNEQGKVTLTFNAPSETQEVHCALFMCPPVIGPRTSSTLITTFADGGGGSDPDGRSPGELDEWTNLYVDDPDLEREIDNAAQCMLGYRRHLGSTGAFDVADPSIEVKRALPPPPEDAQGSCPTAKDNDATPIVARTRLLAGCWAYSETSLIAATQLSPLQVSEVAAFSPLTTSCGDANAEGRGCDLGPAGTKTTTVLGRCVNGECVGQCLLDSDCDVLASILQPAAMPKNSGAVPLRHARATLPARNVLGPMSRDGGAMTLVSPSSIVPSTHC